MTKQFRRSGLIGSASVLALIMGAGGSASAQTITEFSIDLLSDPIEITGAVSGNNLVNTINAIEDLQSASGTSTATIIDNNTAGTLTIGVDPAPFEMNNNTIFARASSNTKENAIGTLPGGTTDGAAILQGQVADDDVGNALPLELKALAENETIEGTVIGDGDGSSEFNENSIFADASFNRTFNTIELPSSADLDPPTGSASVSFVGDPVVQSANLQVMNVQLLTDFETEGEFGNPIAENDDASVLYSREGDGTTFIGGYELNENSIAAIANGNNSDNSVFVTGDGTPSFSGTAAITNVQGSQDSLENGIESDADAGIILFQFFGDGEGGGDGLGGVDISPTGNIVINADDNTIRSTATINTSRNEIGLDGGLVLEGVEGIDDLSNAIIIGGAPSSVDGDYSIANVQLAGDLLGGGVQNVEGDINDDDEETLIALEIEDVDGAGSFSMSGNAIDASGGGNNALNLIGNGEGGSPSVDAIAASLNYQLIEAPESDADVFDAEIRFAAGYDETNEEAFGGFENSTLDFVGNAISATAFGNQAQSANTFDAVALSMIYADESGIDPLNDAASIISNNGTSAAVGDYSVDAGSTILSFQSLELGDNPTDAASVEAQVDDSEIEVFVNDPASPATGEGFSTASIDILNNRIAATGTGNAFVGSNSLTGTDVTASAGIQAVQLADLANIESDVDDGDMEFEFGWGTESAFELDVTIAGNSLIALATVNSIVTTSVVDATNFVGGSDETDELNATLLGSTDDTTPQIAGRSAITADSSVLAVTNQVNFESSTSAEAEGSDITVLFDGGEGGLIEDSAISVLNNTIGGQARGNQATNTVSIDAVSATTAGLGAIGGIVSQQVNANAEAPDLFLFVESEDIENLFGTGVVNFAHVSDSELDVDVTATDATATAVNGNRVIANSASNVVSNTLSVEVGTLTQETDATTGALLTVERNASPTEDVDLTVEQTGAFILNSQRNEAIDPGGIETPVFGGPATIAALALDDDNEITVDMNGDMDNGSLEVLGNAMLATGRANDATNTLSIGVNAGDANGGILNNQINSGSVLALAGIDVDDLFTNSIVTTLDGDNSNVSVTMDGNQIGTSATGNNANNNLSAAATASFSGVAASDGTVATIGGAGTNVLNNGDMFGSGNLVVLNTQTSYAPAEVDEQVILSANTESTIALNAEGDTTNGAFSLSNNGISASASANNANNSITASSATGDLPSATIVSAQRSTGTSVVASVVGADITGTVGGVGALDGGSFTMSGNTIGATSAINSGSNTISSPGQTFTRTASF